MKRRTFSTGLLAAGLAAPPVLGQAVQKKTPGVYIVEDNAFPNSVVEVPTAVPAFVGYTEMAQRGERNVTNVPVRLTSMAEFVQVFGGPPVTRGDHFAENRTNTAVLEPATRFLLYRGMQMFFDNGGGDCWIVSVGGYRTGAEPTDKSTDHFSKAWEVLAKETEPTMLVVPDAVLLSRQDYAQVSNAALAHCADMGNRIAILDVFDGDQARTYDEKDIISGEQGFRNAINSDSPSYGVTYYPWLNTSLLDLSELGPANLSAAGRKQLREKVEAEQAVERPGSAEVAALLDKLTLGFATDTTPSQTHHTLLAISPAYRQAMNVLLTALNIVPPSAAMAGVYARTDNQIGVFAAPANTGVPSVISPTVAISNNDQEDLNVPLDGKAINAIRTFIGRGVLVWGARTLDGNSQDFRYVNVRRTLIMLEQSIAFAVEAYVFAPNDASTWQTVKSMLENFLHNHWKAGALAGSKPSEAYDVQVGLGTTMTGDDILDGYMRVTVRVAIMRPAEFILITFQQRMQAS